MALASVLKRPKLPVFYLVFGPVLIASKKFSLSRDLRSAPLRSLTFRFFPLLNCHPPFGFSSQASTRRFYLPIISIFLFFSTSPLGGWRFFIEKSTGFSPPSPANSFRGFLPTTTLIMYLQARRSLGPREEAIVMTWSPYLVVWPSHLTRRTTSSEHLRSHEIRSNRHPHQTYKLRLILDRYQCHLVSTSDLVGSLTRPIAKELGLSIRQPTSCILSVVLLWKHYYWRR